jgi:hypothetical protein
VELFLTLAVGKLDGSEPFIGQGGDEILIIIVGLKPIKGKKVGPGSWSFVSAGVDSFKEIVIDDVKLGADVIGAKIANQADGTGVKRGRSHVLSLTRPRLPLRYFASILELWLEYIDRAPPRVSVDEGGEGRF